MSADAYLQNAEPPFATAADSPPPIIDLIIEAPSLFALLRVLFVLGIVVLTSATVVIVVVFKTAPRVDFIVGIAALVFVLIVSLAFIQSRRAAARVASLPATITPRELPDVPPKLLGKLDSTRAPMVLSQLVKVLHQRGFAGHVIRVRRDPKSPPPSPIEPIAVPFEPQSLHEVESELMSATDPRRAGDSPRHRQSVGRYIQRNVNLHGGWWAMLASCGVLGVQTVVGLIHSIRAMHPTSMLWLYGGLFLLITFTTLGTDISLSGRWLVLPGALVLRSMSKKANSGGLQLLDRSRSLLIAFQLHRQRWMIYVAATPPAHHLMFPTTAEVEFLLRAWFSPLPTPPLDQLSDFM